MGLTDCPPEEVALPMSRGTLPYTYQGHSESVWTVGWSPNGKYIAAGSDRCTVQVWDAATARHVYTHRGPLTGRWIRAIAWSPDSTRIASGDHEGTVQVWEAVGSGATDL